MKKLLLAFSLIAVFGIGITAASFTLPENTNTTVEVKEGDDKKKKKERRRKLKQVVVNLKLKESLVVKNLQLNLNLFCPFSN